MNKYRLQAELWEIQIILYLILSELVHTSWIRWVIITWAVITFIGCIILLHKAGKEDPLFPKDPKREETK